MYFADSMFWVEQTWLKNYIIKWLAKNFKNGLSDIYLFYSGHGHENGDFAIETIEKPDGDRLSLEELADIWLKNRASNKSQLYIFMDSCYSGSWCIRAADMNVSMNINVLSACSKN